MNGKIFVIIFISCILGVLLYLRYIYPTAYLSQTKINELYRTMKNTDEILSSNDIPYFISCGTLLGAVRDGGLIPWDNDIDICIFQEDLEKFLALKPQFEARNHGFNYADDIHRIDGRVDGVWIDVFPYSKNSKGVYEHVLEKNKNRFSKEYFHESELLPLKRNFTFGNLQLLGPQNERIVLERLYGKNWMTPVQYSKMSSLLNAIKYGKTEKRNVALPNINL